MSYILFCFSARNKHSWEKLFNAYGLKHRALYVYFLLADDKHNKSIYLNALTLLHSKLPELYEVLAILSAIWLM